MATHYIKLEAGITLKDIKAKFKAFEFLYGESKMIVKGDVPTLYKGQLLPAFGVDAEVVKIGVKTLTAKTRREGDIIIPIAFLYTQRPVSAPELMFITVA